MELYCKDEMVDMQEEIITSHGVEATRWAIDRAEVRPASLVWVVLKITAAWLTPPLSYSMDSPQTPLCWAVSVTWASKSHSLGESFNVKHVLPQTFLHAREIPLPIFLPTSPTASTTFFPASTTLLTTLSFRNPPTSLATYLWRNS